MKINCQKAVGNCSTIARFGAVFALLVDAMAEIWNPLPMVLMGSIAVIAGCANIFLELLKIYQKE